MADQTQPQNTSQPSDSANQIAQLNARITQLETFLSGGHSIGASNIESFIRDIVFSDIDNKTTRTQTIGMGGGTVPVNFDTYIRIYFRGNIYNIPAYKLK